jgi:hypothetical protein
MSYNETKSRAARNEVPSETGGWALFLGAIALTLVVAFGLGHLYGPHDQATIASNVRPDGVVTGVGNTNPGEPGHPVAN